jgi:hypothetical protein
MPNLSEVFSFANQPDFNAILPCPCGIGDPLSPLKETADYLSRIRTFVSAPPLLPSVPSLTAKRTCANLCSPAGINTDGSDFHGFAQTTASTPHPIHINQKPE